MNNNQQEGFEIPESAVNLVKTLNHYIRPIIGGILSLILILGSFFQIEPEELGVVTRFGKYVRTVNSGLNLKMPFAETVYTVPVERQQKLEFGFGLPIHVLLKRSTAKVVREKNRKCLLAISTLQM